MEIIFLLYFSLKQHPGPGTHPLHRLRLQGYRLHEQAGEAGLRQDLHLRDETQVSKT